MPTAWQSWTTGVTPLVSNRLFSHMRRRDPPPTVLTQSVTCQDSICSRFAPVPLGGSCVVSSQCPGESRCSPSGICGGAASYCVTDDGSSGGPSVACASGSECPDVVFSWLKTLINIALDTCLYGQCSPLPLVQKGGSCLIDSQCADNLRCAADGICGGVGAYCYNYGNGQQDDDSLCGNNSQYSYPLLFSTLRSLISCLVVKTNASTVFAPPDSAR